LARSLTGTRIRERRRGKKLSQTELARLVGISASYLNLIEHNRRGIAGKTLLAIAENLGVDARSLSEGADRALIMQLREAAANIPAADAEVDRLEEFIGRFPGWARLIDTFQSQSKFQNETLLALSDRLKHDPFFAEAIHMMVSNITAIHSTVGILSDDQDVPPIFSDGQFRLGHPEARHLQEIRDHDREDDPRNRQRGIQEQTQTRDHDQRHCESYGAFHESSGEGHQGRRREGPDRHQGKRVLHLGTHFPCPDKPPSEVSEVGRVLGRSVVRSRAKAVISSSNLAENSSSFLSSSSSHDEFAKEVCPSSRNVQDMRPEYHRC